MTQSQTEEEVLRENRTVMGPELGKLHFLLWRELATLHLNWYEYRALFASAQDKFALMNATAPRFFKRLENSLWDATLLHLCRLTDRPGSADKANLTFMRLALSVRDTKLKAEVEHLTSLAVNRTKFARKRRDKHLAHRDWNRATSPEVHPLPAASRAHVEEALAALRDVLNHLELHFRGCRVAYEDTLGGAGGVAALFYFLKLGHEAETLRKRSLSEGKPK